MRESIGEVRRCVFQAALAALFMISPTATHATIFDDGNDRKFVKDLRAKNPGNLTSEEKAILTAANKVGTIGLCGGKIGGNAFLIRFRGRDAIVTSAHTAVSPERNQEGRIAKERKGCDPENIFEKRAFYMPNVSFADSAKLGDDKDFRLRKVDLVIPPVNWGDIKEGNYDHEADFLVFYLKEDISQDRMPDGSLRGSLAYGDEPIEGNGLYMIGVAKDMNKSLDMAYQERCVMFRRIDRFYHGCDTLKGASSSLLAIYVDSELRFRGLHTTGTEETKVPGDEIRIFSNVGTSSEHVKELMGRYGSSQDFLASDLQWLLNRAGCYSGKLDNQWGPASRKALAAFASAAATELPGTEPSPELLAAVEKVAPEGTEVCR